MTSRKPAEWGSIAIRQVETAVVSVWYAVVVTVALAIVGVSGSVFSSEIGSAFPFVRGPYAGISGPATFFWVALVLTGLLFGLRQWATDRERRAAMAGLQKLIRTTPSPDFLAQAAYNFQSAEKAYSAVMSHAAPPPIDVLDTLKLVIRSFAVLAWKYDGSPSKVTYAANLMVYRSLDELAVPLTQLRKSSMLDDLWAEEQLAGVLRLVGPQLAVRLKGGESEADESLRPLTFGIPHEPVYTRKTDDEKRYRVLPGAPLAFTQRKPDMYANVPDLIEWCKRYSVISPEVLDKIEGYFADADGPKVGSFISIPVGYDESGPIAVINVHRESENLLRESDSAAELFVPAVVGLGIMVWRLLDKLDPKELLFDW